jgi:hypothetical protein
VQHWGRSVGYSQLGVALFFQQHLDFLTRILVACYEPNLIDDFILISKCILELRIYIMRVYNQLNNLPDQAQFPYLSIIVHNIIRNAL